MKNHISIDAQGSLTFSNTAQDDQINVAVPLIIVDRDTILRKNKKRGIINADEYFKDRFKLSLKDGKFCVFEHIDENPIFVNNFGMVSKMHRYVYSDHLLPNDEFTPKNKNLQLMHMGPNGKQILKAQGSKLPLLGNIDGMTSHPEKAKFRGISVLSNKLYRAPVFFHKSKQTDFFCSFYQDKKGGKQIVMREI